MADLRPKMVADIMGLHAKHFGSVEEQALAKRLAQERAVADAAMAYAFANLHMPEDIRSRAKLWGMEAFCELLWNNAFQAGWREANRAKDTEHDR